MQYSAAVFIEKMYPEERLRKFGNQNVRKRSVLNNYTLE